jgi:hypothetical protein
VDKQLGHQLGFWLLVLCVVLGYGYGQILIPIIQSSTNSTPSLPLTNLILDAEIVDVNELVPWGSVSYPASWVSSGNITGITGGQSDPEGGSNATKFTSTLLGVNSVRTASDSVPGFWDTTAVLWVKADAPITVPLAIVWDAGAELIQTDINVTTAWQRFSVTGTATAGRTAAWLQLGIGTCLPPGDYYIYRPTNPTYHTGNLSGLSVVPPFSMMFVHRTHNTSSYKALWGSPTASAIEVRIGTDGKAALLKQGAYGFATASTSVHGNGSWVCTGLVYAANGAYKWYLNGVPDGGPTTDLQTFTAITSPQFGNASQVADLYQGNIARAVIYSDALDDAAFASDYAILKAQLASKLSLP